MHHSEHKDPQDRVYESRQWDNMIWQRFIIISKVLNITNKILHQH